MVFKPADIFTTTEYDFTEYALWLFRQQVASCAVYGEYCQHLGRNPLTINRLEEIPFLPISFFKTHRVYGATAEPTLKFQSSGTTAGGQQRASHYVADAGIYEASYRAAWDQFIGFDGPILALLPSYQQQPGSSLIYMVNGLIERNQHQESGFYTDLHRLFETMQRLEADNRDFLLIGVSYALLDLAEAHPRPFKHLRLMETGGMKGRRAEITRAALHDALKEAFALNQVASEYGMTELLSQAYATADGHFKTPPWMKVMVREANDPFSYCKVGQTGGLNIIDLANFYSCSFIETSDLGRLHASGAFEVLGRFDTAEIRGCNLLWDGN